MRRLPIYFLIDVSESMVGEPLNQVTKGMQTVIGSLRSDPYALETAYVSLICFAGKARRLVPLTEIATFNPACEFPVGSGTSLGEALRFLMHEMDSEVQKTTSEFKGDWKPIIFLFTDGNPTDIYEKAFEKWNQSYRRKCNLIAVSIGDDVNTGILGRITDNVLKLKDTSEQSFKEFFMWVTASIKSQSISVSEQLDDDLKLVCVDGINLEKIDSKCNCNVDENFAVFHCRCSSKKGEYLVKFAKRLRSLERENDHREIDNSNDQYFYCVGAYEINAADYKFMSDGNSRCGTVNTNILQGNASCPCCGNKISLVGCSCGKIFCADIESSKVTCPWCGNTGVLTVADYYANRSRG